MISYWEARREKLLVKSKLNLRKRFLEGLATNLSFCQVENSVKSRKHPIVAL